MAAALHTDTFKGWHQQNILQCRVHTLCIECWSVWVLLSPCISVKLLESGLLVMPTHTMHIADSLTHDWLQYAIQTSSNFGADMHPALCPSHLALCPSHTLFRNILKGDTHLAPPSSGGSLLIVPPADTIASAKSHMHITCLKACSTHFDVAACMLLI